MRSTLLCTTFCENQLGEAMVKRHKMTCRFCNGPGRYYMFQTCGGSPGLVLDIFGFLRWLLHATARFIVPELFNTRGVTEVVQLRTLHVITVLPSELATNDASRSLWCHDGSWPIINSQSFSTIVDDSHQWFMDIISHFYLLSTSGLPPSFDAPMYSINSW